MVLVTGGLGYLGARIVNQLVQNNFKVRIASSRSNPFIPVELSACEIIKIDLTDTLSIDRACKNIKSIIHLASLNHLECEKNPKNAKLINSLGTLKILDSAIKNGVSNFLYFSTCHVYGSSLNGMIDENSPTMPSSHYASSHQIAEDFVLNHSLNGQINTCIFRLTNVIGSPLHKSSNCWMLITNDLCKKIVKNEEASLRANRYIKRDFISIKDIIDATKKYIKNPNLFDQINILNISSGKSTTLENLCNLLEKRTLIGLNRKIRILRDNSSEDFYLQDYYISNKKALQSGLKLNSSLSDEIDLMLLNYEKWFLETR